jgi:hypothetical protein
MRYKRLLACGAALMCVVTLLSFSSTAQRRRGRAVRAALATADDPCSEGKPFRDCKACGTAKGKKAQELNVNKNRDEEATTPEMITVQQMRDPKNNKKFTPDSQVSLTGYVASVVSGGFEESCNCARKDLRDIHINAVAKASEAGDQSKYVVVEFTPRWQQKFGLGDSDYQKMLKKVSGQILHKWVKFDGWMLYDYMHQNASKSTMPKQPVCPNDGKEHPNCNWRATPWEVHPVTSYKMVSGPS